MHWNDVASFVPILLSGALNTVLISVISLFIAAPLGLIWAGCRLSPFPALSVPVGMIVNVVRGLPMIVLLFYIYFVMPDMGITLSSFQASVVGLGFAYSTYLAEIFRSGIESVDPGQMEAARSIGMSKARALSRVVLPQAFRVALPPFSNTLVMMVKDSALASTIAVTEMTREGQLLAASTFQNTTVYTLLALGYLLMSLPLMRMTRVLENRFGKHQ